MPASPSPWLSPQLHRDEFVSEGFLSVIPAGFGRDHPSNKVLMKYIEGNVAPYVVTDKDETILELRVGL